MGMGSSGGRGEVTSDINVTPMADVMLVLLIIFMVVTPMLQKGQSVEVQSETLLSFNLQQPASLPAPYSPY